MSDTVFTPIEESESPGPKGRQTNPREGWKWYLGFVLVLIAGIPVLVLLVFYYREVEVTYYMTRNPLEPSSLHMARTAEGVLIGNMRALLATAEELPWGDSPPSPKAVRDTIGKSIQEGQLQSFAGWAVIDKDEHLLATMDTRDIGPYLDQARLMARDLLQTGGHAAFRTIPVPGRSFLVFLLVAVRTGRRALGTGGVLVGLMNLSSQMDRYMLVPKASSSPGLSYLLSSSGLVLASSDHSMVGKNLADLARGSVLDRFRAGKTGSFVRSIDEKPLLFGSTLLADLEGVTLENWFSVLEAPKDVIDAQADRIRLNMDLIVFLLVPAFMGFVLYLLYRSLMT